MQLFSLLTILLATVYASNVKTVETCRPCSLLCQSERETIVKTRQEQLFYLTKQCDYKAALELSTVDAGYATVDQFCADGSCCKDVGSLEVWWTFFNCFDTIVYPVEPRAINHLQNGTITHTVTELDETYDPATNFTRVFTAYALTYYWDPTVNANGECDYMLNFISGHSMNCPAFIRDAVACSDPICNPLK